MNPCFWMWMVSICHECIFYVTILSSRTCKGWITFSMQGCLWSYSNKTSQVKLIRKFKLFRNTRISAQSFVNTRTEFIISWEINTRSINQIKSQKFKFASFSKQFWIIKKIFCNDFATSPDRKFCLMDSRLIKQSFASRF